MKYLKLFAVIVITVMLSGCGKPKKYSHWTPPATPAFYIWQQDWINDVVQAVSNCKRNLYPICAEFSMKNGSIKCRSVSIPQKIRKEKNLTYVFRINKGVLEKLKANYIAEKFNKLGVKNLQIDLDCPESKLKKYAIFLQELRKLLPNAELSITALPCHIKHSDFVKMLEPLDYYVLQVHGIEHPQNIKDDLSIINRKTAMSSIAQAEKLNFPYLISLPTYAYQLMFDSKKGKFCRLFSRRTKFPDKKYICKLSKLDTKLIRDIIKMKRKGGIIWFRLPVKNDSLNLNISAIEELESGNIPKPSVKLYFKHGKSGFIELFVSNQNMLKLGHFEAEISWQTRMAEFDLLNGAENLSKDRSFMKLPSKISIPYPECGRKLKVGRFYLKQEPEKIIIKNE